MKEYLAHLGFHIIAAIQHCVHAIIPQIDFDFNKE